MADLIHGGGWGLYLRKPLRLYTERGQERLNVASDAEHIHAQMWVAAEHFRW